MIIHTDFTSDILIYYRFFHRNRRPIIIRRIPAMSTFTRAAAPWAHNHQKKIAAVNDFTGFGHCSLSVALPIISRLGVQCCAAPTALLSNHTAFPSCYIDDLTMHFLPYTDEWKKLDLHFDGILTGYLGSLEQISMVERFISDFSDSDTLVIVDPVMGDHGCRYRNFTDEICLAMRRLVGLAHIITPNLTEACLLSDTDFHDGVWRTQELDRLLDRLHDLGPEQIVVTGIPQGKFIANRILTADGNRMSVRQLQADRSYSGTGDIFASILAADAVNGVDLIQSVRRSSSFVKKCIVRSAALDIPGTDGVCFEELLGTLQRMASDSSSH